MVTESVYPLSCYTIPNGLALGSLVIRNPNIRLASAQKINRLGGITLDPFNLTKRISNPPCRMKRTNLEGLFALSSLVVDKGISQGADETR